MSLASRVPEPDPLIPAKQFAALVGRCTRTIKSWSKLGIIKPAIVIRGKLYFRGSDLAALTGQGN